MSQPKEHVFASLLHAGVLPPLATRADESALTYLRRCADALAKRYEDIPIDLTLLCDAGGLEENFELANTPPEDIVVAAFQVDTPHTVIAAGFEAEFGSLHTLLPASLIDHLRLASQSSFDAFTPLAALEMAEYIYFDGDVLSWLEQMRMEAASELGRSDTDVTNAELRHFLRAAGVRTPGAFKRQIGAAHARMRHDKNRLSLERCAEIIERGPRTTRANGLRLVESLTQLYRTRDVLERILSRSDREIWGSVEAEYAYPGLLIEPRDDRHEQLVIETVEELWQQLAQDRGFGPNFVMALRGARDGARLVTVLDALNEASNAVADIVSVMASA